MTDGELVGLLRNRLQHLYTTILDKWSFLEKDKHGIKMEFDDCWDDMAKAVYKNDYVAEPEDSNPNVNHPAHYQSSIECIDAMRAAFGDESVKDFCINNAFKYLFRHKHKGHNEDIQKAKWYLDKYLELGGCEA